MNNEIEFVASHLSEEELLCQIAEEASELAQAALKRRRAITQNNPTPTPPETALYDLYMEYGDLLNAAQVYLKKMNLIQIGGNTSKLERWVERLKEKDEYKGTNTPTPANAAQGAQEQHTGG